MVADDGQQGKRGPSARVIETAGGDLDVAIRDGDHETVIPMMDLVSWHWAGALLTSEAWGQIQFRRGVRTARTVSVHRPMPPDGARHHSHSP